jgi:2-oxoisovalerate dehydrogenase E2 component (dihydrolipoyl transacylase)
VESFVLPQPGEGIVEVEVLKWLVKPDAQVKEYEVLCEARSDKGFIEYKAPYDGKLRQIYFEEAQMALIGKPLYAIEVDDLKYPASKTAEATSHKAEESRPKASAKLEPSRPPVSQSQESMPQASLERGGVPAVAQICEVWTSPAVRHIALVNQIDLSALTPTGPKGRLLKGDLLAYLEKSYTSPGPKPTAASVRPIVPVVAPSQVSKASAQLRGMVKSMTESLKIPHLTYCDDVKVGSLLELRQRLKSRCSTKLTVSPFFIKALSLAMKDFPIINSSFTKDDCSEYRIFASHNVSVAMDTPVGLIVPNIKHVESLSIPEIAAELNRLQDLAAQGRLTAEELEGGTVALSNLGSFGGTYTRPVILPPQVVIGGVSGARSVLARKHGKVVQEQVITVSWSADHRLLDGATVARFGNRWKEIVEDPLMFLS